MSTNKTQNYALHAWVPEDDFLLSEINENFAAVDGVLPFNKKLCIVAGSYLGAGGSAAQTISLPFRPKAVVVSARPNTTCPLSAICVDGTEGSASLVLTEEGFAVNNYLNLKHTVESGYIPGTALNPYHYIAFHWEE